MENYPNNSIKARDQKNSQPPEKHVEKIINGTAKTAKKNGVKQFLSLFISDDIDNLPLYIFKNIVLPNIKRTLLDSASIALNGDIDRDKKRYSTLPDYQGGYSSKQKTRYDTPNAYDIDDVIIDNYGEAEMVLEEMKELISKYGVVSVLDLYDMLGISGTKSTDAKYGWNSVRSATIKPTRGGFILKLPRAIPLDY